MKRSFRAIARAPLQGQFWRLYVNIIRSFHCPARAAAMYTFGFGSYPRQWRVRTPTGTVCVNLYSPDDLVTLVECFGKLDYKISGEEVTIVDLGSNIGMSALYFLTHAPNSHVYLFEPVPTNVERLVANLDPFLDRTTISQHAIGLVDGWADFVVEPTGRYGGLGVVGPDTIRVQVSDANRVLSLIAAERRTIDVLKLDIEGMEVSVLQRLSSEVLSATKVIYAEVFDDPISLDGYVRRQQGAIARFERATRST